MPVPIATTHKKGVGVAGATHAPLETAGPFARLQQLPKEGPDRINGGSQTSDAVQAAGASPAVAQQPAAVQQQSSPADAVQAAPAFAIETNGLSFTYPGIDGRPLPGAPTVVENMSVQLRPGSRCLLIGPNGAGKTSLLRILAGKHKVPESVVSVLGKSPFYATELTTSGDVAYIGGNWERDVAFAGYSVPLQGGFSAGEMINNVQGVAPERRERLMRVLDVVPSWNMNQVSDGQRRRVQICMGLLRPFKALFLDEVTTDLDVLGRADLMQFLQSECEEQGATIVYATHIFDGLEAWPTHLMYVADGKLQEFAPAERFPELQEGRLLELVEKWLRAEKAERQKRLAQQPKQKPAAAAQPWNNGFAAGTLTSTLKLAHSSNAVVRN